MMNTVEGCNGIYAHVELKSGAGWLQLSPQSNRKNWQLERTGRIAPKHSSWLLYKEDSIYDVTISGFIWKFCKSYWG